MSVNQQEINRLFTKETIFNKGNMNMKQFRQRYDFYIIDNLSIAVQRIANSQADIKLGQFTEEELDAVLKKKKQKSPRISTKYFL